MAKGRQVFRKPIVATLVTLSMFSFSWIAVGETETHKVRAGERSSLLCESSSQGTYSWTKDGNPVAVTTSGIDFISINQNRLIITQMSHELVGKYQCFLMNDGVAPVNIIQLYIVELAQYDICKNSDPPCSIDYNYSYYSSSFILNATIVFNSCTECCNENVTDPIWTVTSVSGDMDMLIGEVRKNGFRSIPRLGIDISVETSTENVINIARVNIINATSTFRIIHKIHPNIDGTDGRMISATFNFNYAQVVSTTSSSSSTTTTTSIIASSAIIMTNLSTLSTTSEATSLPVTPTSNSASPDATSSATQPSNPITGPVTTTTSAPSDLSLSYSTASMSPSSVTMPTTSIPTSATNNNDNGSSLYTIAIIGGVMGGIIVLLFMTTIVFCILKKRMCGKGPFHIYETVTYSKTTNTANKHEPLYDTIKDEAKDHLHSAVKMDSSIPTCGVPIVSCTEISEDACNDKLIDTTVDQNYYSLIASSANEDEGEHGITDQLSNDSPRFGTNIYQISSTQGSFLSSFHLNTNSAEPTDKGDYGVINQPKCDDPNFEAIVDKSHFIKIPRLLSLPLISNIEPTDNGNYGVINQPKCDDPNLDTIINQSHLTKVSHFSSLPFISDITEQTHEGNYGVINQPKCDYPNIDTVTDQIHITKKSNSSLFLITYNTKPTDEDEYGVINQPKCDDPYIDTTIDRSHIMQKSYSSLSLVTTDGKPTDEDEYGVINQPKCDDSCNDNIIGQSHITENAY